MVNFIVGTDTSTKQRAGDELTINEFQSLVTPKFDTYSPEYILNIDETQLSSTLTSKVIKSSDRKIRYP